MRPGAHNRKLQLTKLIIKWFLLAQFCVLSWFELVRFQETRRSSRKARHKKCFLLKRTFRWPKTRENVQGGPVSEDWMAEPITIKLHVIKKILFSSSFYRFLWNTCATQSTTQQHICIHFQQSGEEREDKGEQRNRIRNVKNYIERYLAIIYRRRILKGNF